MINVSNDYHNLLFCDYKRIMTESGIGDWSGKKMVELVVESEWNRG